MTDTGTARNAHTRGYRDQKDALHNQLEAAGHAIALTRGLRGSLTGASPHNAGDLAGLLAAALDVDPAQVTVGHLPRNGLQIRVLS